MKWEVAPLFAVPVFKFSVPDTDRVTKFFNTHISKAVDEDRDQQGHLSHYYSRQNVLAKFDALKTVEQNLRKAANYTYKELMNYSESGDLEIINAWFNLCEVGGSQPAHNHANSLLSGTLYLNTDEFTALDFYHPVSSSSYHAELYDKPADKANPHGLKFHQRQARIRVKNGDCLFWPSHLKHGYQNNQTSGRLTLSFNLMPSLLNLDYSLSLGAGNQ